MDYLITPDAPCDRSTILELWGRNLPTAAAGRYAWMYEAGPAQSWLARTADGAVVGSTGLMAREMKFGLTRCRVGQAIDLNVDSDHRTGGPALKLQRAVVAAIGSEEGERN